MKTASAVAGNEALVAGGLGRRVAARTLDLLIAGVVGAFVSNLAGLPNEFQHRLSGSERWALALVGTSIMALYDAVFVVSRGWTPGKRALGLRVVVVGAHIPLPLAATIRAVALFGLLLVPLAGPILLSGAFLVALADTERRTLWDRLAGTRVVLVGPSISTPKTMVRMAEALANDENISPPSHRSRRSTGHG